MSLESNWSKGFLATLLIIILPIAGSLATVPLRLFNLPTSNSLYISLFNSSLGIVGFILLLKAMNGLSKAYDEPKIYKNILYGFIANLIGVIASFLVMIIFILPIINQITSYPITVDMYLLLSEITKGAAIYLIVLSVFTAITGYFNRLAFNALAEKSGEGNFRTAGSLMLLGGALTIVIVGGVLFFIGWIVAFIGFSSMKNKPNQTSFQNKYCPSCGAENNLDSNYCKRCGNKL
jgi:uncharacterized membrane protein